MSDAPKVLVPDMCRLHQRLLLDQAGYGPDDTWRALIIMAQIALFQGATADPTLHERLGGDITKLPEIGCLACFKPDRFGEIVEAAKLEKTAGGTIKRLGESWLK